jgi:hypothetical protein
MFLAKIINYKNISKAPKLYLVSLFYIGVEWVDYVSKLWSQSILTLDLRTNLLSSLSLEDNAMLKRNFLNELFSKPDIT